MARGDLSMERIVLGAALGIGAVAERRLPAVVPC